MTPPTSKDLLKTFLLPVDEDTPNPEVRAQQGKHLVEHALALLRPHLPVALPLYRRLQGGRFLAESRILCNVDISQRSPATTGDGDAEEWLIAFVDRSCRPETEVWMFGSWEVRNPTQYSDEQRAQQDELIRCLAVSIKSFGVPMSIHQDVLDAEAAELQASADDTDSVGYSRSQYAGHMSNTNILLCGSVHTSTVAVLQRNGLVSFQFKTGLVPNHTFIFDVDALPPTRALPDGLRWGIVEPHHFSLIRARTQIPRQERTLAKMANVAILDNNTGVPVSWAFAGLDASLTSLYVEPEWRGQGLAKTVTVKLFTEAMDLYWEKAARREAHAYVVVGNDASCRVCRSLGGISKWEVYWARVDLGNL